MKQMVCEMCGGTNLIKQDGVFVCQTCGTKYSIEEAKKMIIEGKIDVSGSTVKVDSTNRLENLYKIARRAKDEENSENAAKYYDMILVDDPNSWEAAFYAVYFRAMECKIAQISSVALSLENCLSNVFSLINKYVLKEKDRKSAIKEVTYRSILAANILSDGAKSHYAGISVDIRKDYTQEYIDRVCGAIDICYTCGNVIEKLFSKEKGIVKNAIDAWKAGIKIHESIMSYFADAEENKSVILSYEKKIGKYDEDFANSVKKRELESEIARLKSEKLRILHENRNSRSEELTSGVLVVIVGAFVVVLKVFADVEISIFYGIIPLIIGALLIWTSTDLPTEKEIYAEKLREAEKIQKRISAKEDELAKLK